MIVHLGSENTRKSHHAFLVFILAATSLLLLVPAAMGQEAHRVYVDISSEGMSVDAVQEARMAFEREIARDGFVVVVSAEELAALEARCDELGQAESGAERECRLRAARQAAISRYVQITTRAGEHGHHVTMVVWDPDKNEKTGSTTESSDADTSDTLLREAVPRLASTFRCTHGDKAACAQEDTSNGETSPHPPVSSADVPPIAAESAAHAAPGAREIAFSGREDESWVLRMPGGAVECALPCTRWVAPKSGLVVEALASNGSVGASAAVPDRLDTLGGSSDAPLVADLYVSSDWQWQEPAAWASLLGGMGSMVGGVLWGGSEDNVTISLILGLSGLMVSVFGTTGFLVHHSVVAGPTDKLLFQDAKTVDALSITLAPTGILVRF